MSYHSSSNPSHSSSSGARNRRMHTAETAQHSYPPNPQRRATAPAPSSTAQASAVNYAPMYGQNATAPPPLTAQSAYGVDHVADRSPRHSGVASPVTSSGASRQSSIARQTSSGPSPGSIGHEQGPYQARLTNSGLPQFMSDWLARTDRMQPYDEFTEVARRILYGVATAFMGEGYNTSRDVVSNIDEFAQLARNYKNGQENVVVRNILQWILMMMQIGDAERGAKAACRGLKQLASLSLFSQDRSTAPSLNPLTGRVTFSTRQAAPATDDASFAITSVFMILLQNATAEIRDAQNSGQPGVNDVVYIEDIINGGGASLGGVSDLEESLSQQCEDLRGQARRILGFLSTKSSDFYASPRTYTQVFSCLWRRVNSIYGGIIMCAAAFGSFMQNTPPMVTDAIAAVAVVVMLNSVLTGIKNYMDAKAADPMSTPKVAAIAAEASRKLRENGILYLMSLEELCVALDAILRVRRGERQMSHAEMIQIALVLNSMATHVDSGKGPSIEMASRNVQGAFKAAHPTMFPRTSPNIGEQPHQDSLLRRYGRALGYNGRTGGSNQDSILPF
ncbi:hypothetical protein HDZ31DRAFT_66171 [Schizophyllum fasciatum]